MTKAISAPKSEKQRYLRRLQAAILRHGLYNGNVHADAVVIGLPVPDGVHCNTVGSAFAGLEAEQLIEAVGFERSRRQSRHRGVSRIWRVCNHAGASRYLTALTRSDDIDGDLQ